MAEGLHKRVTTLENLNASMAQDFIIVRERVANEGATIALEYAHNRFRSGSETLVLTLNPSDHWLIMPPTSFSARAKLFGLATCAALIALILAFFYSMNKPSSPLRERGLVLNDA
jgi:hypothetical protein